jgi:acyl carrier protein
MTATTTTLDEVRDVLVATLGLEDGRDQLDASTELFGALPELDSLAVLELVSAMEDRFHIVVEDEEFSGEIFETLGTLARFVASKLEEA